MCVFKGTSLMSLRPSIQMKDSQLFSQSRAIANHQGSCPLRSHKSQGKACANAHETSILECSKCVTLWKILGDCNALQIPIDRSQCAVHSSEVQLPLLWSCLDTVYYLCIVAVSLSRTFTIILVLHMCHAVVVSSNSPCPLELPSGILHTNPRCGVPFWEY